MFISVDLPHPDGPTTVTNSLSAMVRSTPSTAVNGVPFRSKTAETWSKWIFGVRVVIGAPASR